MDFWHSIGGMVQVEIVGADLGRTLTESAGAGITLYDTQMADAITATTQVRRTDYRRLKKIASSRGDHLRICQRKGLYWTVKGLLKRPVFLLGLAVILFMGAFLPTRIFFFRVEGNVNVPTNLILEQAAQCGIGFGASRRLVRSEKLKNALLQKMPQLQWAGINTSGCVATISVREREPEILTPVKGGVSSIVAAVDGVISSFTVTKGSPACKVGQAVKAGELLISGYTDCGLSIRASQADGEVYARTARQFSAVSLSNYLSKSEKTAQIKKYSLIFGKKQINFYKDSGILDTTCDKMYLEKYVTLPGGFRLPLGLRTEVWTYYTCVSETQSQEEVAKQLSDFGTVYLNQQMIAGRIISKSEEFIPTEQGMQYLGSYACEEMIGRVQQEELIAPNGKFNGTDSKR